MGWTFFKLRLRIVRELIVFQKIQQPVLQCLFSKFEILAVSFLGIFPIEGTFTMIFYFFLYLKKYFAVQEKNNHFSRQKNHFRVNENGKGKEFPTQLLRKSFFRVIRIHRTYSWENCNLSDFSQRKTPFFLCLHQTQLSWFEYYVHFIQLLR